MITINNKELDKLTFIDLFAGIGGFRLALESLGAKCVFSSEIDKKARETYANNFGDIPYGDIKTISEKDIPKHDILCAGFPCQSFSAGGKKLGFNDPRGTLFFEIARIVKYQQPKIVLLENVKHLVAHDNGQTLTIIKDTMEKLGYSFYSRVLNAADYGIPQQRFRTYMVCFRNDLGVSDFSFPFAIPLTTCVKDLLINDENIISKLYKNRDIYPPSRKPKCDHNEVILYGFFNKGRQGERVYNTSGVSITLGTTNKGFYLVSKGQDGNAIVRKLHQRECARLMGFPDSYVLHKTPLIAYHQIGNSVVVDVIQYIAISIAKALRNESIDLSLT